MDEIEESRGAARRYTSQAVLLTIGVWTLACGLLIVPNLIRGDDLSMIFLLHLGALYLSGIGLTSLIHWVLVAVTKRRIWIRIPALFAAITTAGGLLAAVDFAASLWLASSEQKDIYSVLATSLGNLIGFMLLYGLLTAFLLILRSNRLAAEREAQLAKAREQAAQARAQANAATLAALRYQLNPHLLFNALNAASSLVINRRNDEAEALLEKLAEFLRTTLVADSGASVPLGKELDTIESYLAIEAIRFGDRLRVAIDCPSDLEEALTPSFLLQPLVENAIKYAVAPTRMPIDLRITAERRGADIWLTVEDDGDPVKAATVSPGTSLGLANVRQRLAALYGKAAQLEIDRLPNGFRARVVMPLSFAGETEQRVLA